MYLLDTNVVSELRRPRPHQSVLNWIQDIPADLLHLSSVTIGETQAGIEITREQDPAKADEIETWLERVLDSYEVLPVDAAAFREWARLMHRQADKLIQDALIAAVAIVHRLTVVTRNTRDFDHLNVPVLNPFEAPPFRGGMLYKEELCPDHGEISTGSSAMGLFGSSRRPAGEWPVLPGSSV